jgi:hypothetical protein
VVVLLLSSKRPMGNTLAFTLPSIAGSMLVGVVLVLALQGQNFSQKSNASTLTLPSTSLPRFSYWSLFSSGGSCRKAAKI